MMACIFVCNCDFVSQSLLFVGCRAYFWGFGFPLKARKPINYNKSDSFTQWEDWCASLCACINLGANLHKIADMCKFLGESLCSRVVSSVATGAEGLAFHFGGECRSDE